MSDTLLGIDVDEMDKQIEEELKANVTIAIRTDDLKTLIGKVERTVSKKVVQDILRFIYLDFQEDKIVARAMNSEYTTEAVLHQNEEGTNFKITDGRPASICFPADKLAQIVRRLRTKNSSITIKSNNALFKSGRPEFDLNGVDGSEFPRTPEVGDSISTLTLHADVLSTMYDRTVYAASAQETRPTLTGVNHIIQDNRLTCVSTDSHRLAQYVYDFDTDVTDTSALIPAKILAEVNKHLSATSDDVTVRIANSYVIYNFGDVTLYARRLEGAYPDTSRLIFSSEQAVSTFTVHAGTFSNLLNNSTVYNPDQPIIIRVKPELNQMRVNTREAEVGSFQEDLSVTDGTGGDLALAVNVRYLQEALSRYGSDDYVTFEFLPSTEQKPAGMQPFKAQLKNGNPNCLELFVPVRTDQIKYNEEVVIDDFQGVPEFEFNPFEDDFEEIE